MTVVVKEFVQEFVEKKIANTKYEPDAVENFIKSKLEIKTYLPFRDKRKLVETVVESNISVVDGIKKYDSINAYIGFVVSTLIAHTNLEFGEDPAADYDLLAASGLLPLIIQEFSQSYAECETLLKMAVASELEDNNLNMIVNKFLNGILDKFDGVNETIKGFVDNFDWSNVLGKNINKEDMAKLFSFVDKLE